MARAFTNDSSQYLEASSTPVTAVPLTMACWFYSTEDANKDLMCIGSSSDQSNFILRALDNEYVYASTYDGGTYGAARSASKYGHNAWHHACGVWTDVDARAVFLDGANKGTESTSVTPVDQDRIGIGCYIWGGSTGHYFDGYIAEAAIWNAALTDSEVAILAAGFSPLLVRPASLVFYAPLIRDEDRDIVGGLSLSPQNTPSVTAHPPVLGRALQQIVVPVAGGAPPATPIAAIGMDHYRRRRV